MSTSLAGTVSGVRAAGSRLSLLGPFNLEQDGRAVRLRTRKEQALLAYLVLYPDSHSREVLAELCWGDTPERQARASLRAALADLRAALGPDALLSDRVVVQFSPAATVQVDVLEFRAQATRFLSDASANPATFDPGLYSGELLTGHYDDWVLIERERLQQLYLDALLHQVGRLRGLARYGEAIASARQVLTVDPAEERAHRHLIFLYDITGNRSAALRQFENCRRSLKEELDVEPSAETLALVESITRAYGEVATTAAATVGAAAAETMAATAGGADAQLTNLPMPLTSFVGRERELGEVGGLLQDGGSPTGGRRLVTLTGAGGSGKTRLAIEAARRIIPQRRHGVWWVDLSSLQDPALLPDTVLAQLGVAAAPGQPPVQTLIIFLRQRSLLLVLDNCEHLAEACAHLATSILQSCPGVQMLATSREPLGVPGEQLWPVPTFSVPTAEKNLDPECLLSYDAVRLFVERARMHQPTFELTSDNAAQVAEICRQLEGIPLAIELAAARVRAISLDDILTRLQNRLRLLVSGSTLAPPRHQTLRASIDWSYNQLTEAERLLLQRLAVFVGGCTLATAERICAVGELAEDEVVDLLGRLVDRSLVIPEGGRYRLLETIREYALERLVDAGEAETLRDRHSDYYLTLVRELESRLCSHHQKQALVEMASEVSNIRLALAWAIDRHKIEQLRQVSFPLLYFYEIRGWYREGESIFRDAAAKLQKLAETDPERERSRQISLLDMETNQAYFGHRLGRPAEAYALHRRCSERLRSLGDEMVLRYSLRYCGIAAMTLGRFDEAESYLNESHELSRAAERPWDIGIDNAYLGGLARERGALEQAQDYYSQALEISRKLGDPRLFAFSCNGLGFALIALGQPIPARELAEQALSLAQETGDRYDLANSWALLGQVASRLGEPAKARGLLAKSIELLKETGDTIGLISAYCRLGHLALAIDDTREAESHFRTAASIATEYQLDVPAINALAGWASVLARKGAAEYALEPVTFILHHPLSSVAARDLAEQLRAELEAQLTPEQIQDIELCTCSEPLAGIVQKLLAGSIVTS